jgi:MoaA/NifB/PqqE/SkfB family radical SAM enzyme
MRERATAAQDPLPTLQEYNRKNRRPSEAMTDSDGFHYRCSWIEGGLTVHSDGNVRCGLDDPHGQRSFGNVKETPIGEIFANPEYGRLQDKLWRGHRCHGCGLYRRVESHDPPPANRPHLPVEPVVETSVKCNIRCPNTACIPNNNSLLKTRDADSLGTDTLRSVADQLSTSLETIHFYNYGEPFLNRRAEEMLLYLREKCPGALIVTSTNAIPLSNPSRAEKVVAAGLDRVIVTISGVTQEVYGRYHATGKCEQALAGVKNLCDAKRRNGRTLPAVILRYLVFHWNDSDAQIDGVIALAEEYGVDRLTLFLTDEPQGARSVRYSPGSPSYHKYKKYIRFDHVERLDHLYHCELPDDDGLFRSEVIPGFGEVRRTSSEATLRRNGRRGRLRLWIATDRPLSRERGQVCLVRTPWRTVKFDLTFGRWVRVSIPVPPEFRDCGPVEITVTTDDFWFPAEECPNTDLRCLGVLVREESLVAAGASRLRLLHLRTLATLRKSWRCHVSRTVLGRFLSSCNAVLSDTTAQLRPGDAAGSRQAPRPIDDDTTASREARRHAESIVRLYRTVFGRDPEPDGLNGWVRALMDGSGRWSPVPVAQDFVSTPEFREVYGESPTAEAFVVAACRNALGREPDPADCRKWTDYLTRHGNGKAAKAATALGIADSMAYVDFQLPTTRRLNSKPRWISMSRVNPRQTTILPGGGSFARAR